MGEDHGLAGSACANVLTQWVAGLCRIRLTQWVAGLCRLRARVMVRVRVRMGGWVIYVEGGAAASVYYQLENIQNRLLSYR